MSSEWANCRYYVTSCPPSSGEVVYAEGYILLNRSVTSFWEQEIETWLEPLSVMMDLSPLAIYAELQMARFVAIINFKSMLSINILDLESETAVTVTG